MVKEALTTTAAAHCLLASEVVEQYCEDLLEEMVDGQDAGTSSDSEYSAEAFDQMLELRNGTTKSAKTLITDAKELSQLRKPPPVPTPRLSRLPLIFDGYMMNDLRRFRRNLRVAPMCFLRLEEKLGGHELFQRKPGPVDQLPVRYQLAIALYWFFPEGSAVGTEDIAQWATVSSGMVTKATRRVIKAVLSFHDEAIRWATDEEKKEAKAWVEGRSCKAWRNRAAQTVVYFFSTFLDLRPVSATHDAHTSINNPLEIRISKSKTPV
jgi:hypothetical protein